MPRVAQGLKALGSNNASWKEEPVDEGVSPNSSGVAKVQKKWSCFVQDLAHIGGRALETVLETEDSGAAPVFMVAYNHFAVKFLLLLLECIFHLLPLQTSIPRKRIIYNAAKGTH